MKFKTTDMPTNINRIVPRPLIEFDVNKECQL